MGDREGKEEGREERKGKGSKGYIQCEAAMIIRRRKGEGRRGKGQRGCERGQWGNVRGKREGGHGGEVVGEMGKESEGMGM